MAGKGEKTLRDRGDLLAIPLLGPLIGSPRFIITLQCFTLSLFLAALYFGYTHPEKGQNFYTTGLFWGLFWPFFIFIVTPLFGKVFCAICPHRLLIFPLGNRFGLKRKAAKWLTSGWVSLFVVLLLYWFPIYAWPGVFHDPLNTAIYFSLFTAVALLFAFYYHPEAWCKGVCPVALPTNLVSRIAFLGIRTYRKKCDACKLPTCFLGRDGFEGCPHGINPSFMKENSDCTLCMKCVPACSYDAVRFGVVSPLSEFGLAKRRRDMPEAMGVILLFGALTLTMQFYNGLYRGMLRENYPLFGTGRFIHELAPSLMTLDGGVGLVTFLFSVTFALSWYLLFSAFAARVTGNPFGETLELLAWTLLPVFALSSFSQMGEFFSFRYYPMIAAAFLDLFNVVGKTRPLASMNSPWLVFFKLFAFGGAIWSIVFTWKVSGRLTPVAWKRGVVSFPFWLLYLLVLLAFAGHMVVMLFLDIPGVTGPRGSG